MKNLILIVASFFLFSACSNAGNPPQAVLDAFKTKFPAAEKVKWGMENKTVWEAEFTLNGTDESANFTTDGTWIETETEIAYTALPNAVGDAINKLYAGYTIGVCTKTETPKNGIIYEAMIKKDKDKKEVVFKEDGTEVKE